MNLSRSGKARSQKMREQGGNDVNTALKHEIPNKQNCDLIRWLILFQLFAALWLPLLPCSFHLIFVLETGVALAGRELAM